jgi:hypothetical protein
MDHILESFFLMTEQPNWTESFPNPKESKEEFMELIIQQWNDFPNPMGFSCRQRIEEHQKMIELEEGFEPVYVERGMVQAPDRMREYLKNCDLRPFSRKRLPAAVHRITNIRNKFFGVISGIPFRIKTPPPNSQYIPLKDGSSILNVAIINKLFVVKSERLFGIPQPPSSIINLIEYNSQTFGNLHTRVLLSLYKECLYANMHTEANSILDFMAGNRDEIRTQFLGIAARVALNQNRLEDAFRFSREAGTASQLNPKFYECLSEVLFRMFLRDSQLFVATNESILKDFFDSLQRILAFSYQKSESRIFGIILTLFTIFQDRLQSMNRILPSFLTRLPPNFLRAHFYEIALCFSDDVLKIIYERLCHTQLLEFYYVFDTFTYGVNSETDPKTDFFHPDVPDDEKADMADGRSPTDANRQNSLASRTKHKDMFNGAVRILKDYLPRQTCMLNDLGTMANNIVSELELDVLILIRGIIDDAYDTGRANRRLLHKLVERDNNFWQPIQNLREKPEEASARFYSLICFLEQALWERRDYLNRSTLAQSLLRVNTIFYPLAPKNLLYIDSSNVFEEYRISPLIHPVEHNDSFALQLDVFSRSFRKQKLLMVPKTRQNLIDNLIFDQLSSKVSELIISDPRATDSYRGKSQNLLYALPSWIIMIRSDNQQ